MNFELSLYTVLVFLVPGSFAAFALALLKEQVVRRLIFAFEQPTVVEGVLFLGIAFALGALVDSVRTLSLDWATKLLANVRQPNYLKKLNKDSLPVFEFVLQRTHEYYRFNSNCALSLALLSLSLACARPWHPLLLLLIPLAALLLSLAVRQQGEIATILGKLP